MLEWIIALLTMKGYGAYVWSSYLLMVLAIALHAYFSLRSHAIVKKKLIELNEECKIDSNT